MRSRVHASNGKGRPRIFEAALTEQCNIRVDKTTLTEIVRQARKSKTTLAELIRTYITWGLEIDNKEAE